MSELNFLRCIYLGLPEIKMNLILNDEFVWDGRNQFGNVVLGGDGVGEAWLPGLALDDDTVSGGLGIALDTVQEVQAALGVLDVFDADVDPLGQDPSADALVDDDSDSVLRDVEHTAGLAVVNLPC